MTLQLDAEIERAVIHGPPRRLMDGSAPTVMENIARRVAEAPDGLMRSFQSDGTLREQTFAEAWRRSGDIAARLRRLGVGPGSQTVMLLGDLLDFVPSFWASLRVGATPMPLSGVAHVATAEELNEIGRASGTPCAYRRRARRPTSAGSRLCCPMRRSSAFRRSRAKPTRAKMKR